MEEGEPTIRFTATRERYVEKVNPLVVGFWYGVVLIGAILITIGVS